MSTLKPTVISYYAPLERVHWLPCRDLELSGEAMEAIGDFYSELRQTSDQRALPVTVRTLETVIRLSTAAARARLAKSVQQVGYLCFTWQTRVGICTP